MAQSSRAISKGPGDWDEAIIIGRHPDGTYSLEYPTEGLIEEGVPAERIRLPSGDAAGGVSDEPPLTFAEGETVMANFKGLGDWDEALIIGRHPDGTYSLEYVDEGLIEEVPSERIAKAGGADAEASAGISLAVGEEEEEEPAPRECVTPQVQSERRGGEEEEEESSDDDEDDDPLASTEPFAPSRSWRGPKPGYCFKSGEQGVGYYVDVPLHAAAEAEEKARDRTHRATAIELGDGAAVDAAECGEGHRHIDLFDLASLRVRALGGASKGGKGGGGSSSSSSPFLFPSLEGLFTCSCRCSRSGCHTMRSR